MKIAAIEYFPTSTKGGSEKAFFEVLSALSKQHDVTLFYTEAGDLLSKYKEAKINCVYLPSYKVNYLDFKQWYTLVKNARVLGLTKCDVIYINQLADIPLAFFASYFCKAKIVCHLRVPKIGNSRLFNFLGKKVNVFISVNKLIKTQYASVFGDKKIIIINDGIRILGKHEGKLRNVKEATYLGRISKEKGLIALINCWKLLKDKYHLNIKLNITGPASTSNEIAYRNSLHNLLKKEQLQELISINEAVKDPIVYLKKFDFSVFPSVIDEAFGRTIPESILAGTPVFARRVGIVEDILAPAKDFIYETEEELAEKIALFYEDKLSFRLENLQQHIMNHYDISKNVIQIEQTLLSTIEK